MKPEPILNFLSRTALCHDLPPAILAALASKVRLRVLHNGQTLVEQGAPGDSLFFVVDGRLEARLRGPGSGALTVLGRIGHGEVVGEMAALSGEPRLCSVVAIRESRVLELDRADFLDVLMRHPATLARVTQQIIRRAHDSSAQAERVSVVALIPHGPQVDLGAFAQRLLRALRPLGDAGLVQPGDARLSLGSDTLTGHLASIDEPRSAALRAIDEPRSAALRAIDEPRSAALRAIDERRSAALRAIEERHDLLLYLGDSGSTEWNRLAVRQADLILVVAEAGADPALSEFEASALFGERPLSAARIELVLLQGDRATAPQGTGMWLQRRAVPRHHHIARAHEPDYARLARRLVGQGVHLVLSGGGARGFAHIGVMRALREAQIPVDYVGGTSIGATGAAMYAMGWEWQDIRDAVRRFAGGVKDRTAPVLSLFSGRHWTRVLQAMYPGDIEDLWLSFFAVSVDLLRAEEHVHRRGPVWLALRASTSIPGLFPPVRADGRYLVDGGVLNNTPIDVMAASAHGQIIEVDVSQDFAFPAPLEHAPGVSGWRLLGQRMNPFHRGPTGPNIGDVLVRSAEIAAVRIRQMNRDRTPVALTITPPVSQHGTLDFHSLDEVVEAGYQHALAALQRWRAAG